MASGQEYVSPTLASLLIRRSRRAAALAEQKPALTGLTPTERRILKLIAEGQTSREIAALLNIGVRTVVGTLGGDFSWASHLNSSGLVTGYSKTPSGDDRDGRDALTGGRFEDVDVASSNGLFAAFTIDTKTNALRAVLWAPSPASSKR